MINSQSHLYDWLFHYNHHTNSWAAFKREDIQDYFNGNYKNVIKSKTQKTLEGLITAHEGDLESIQDFMKKIK
jgi:hypothetical protein